MGVATIILYPIEEYVKPWEKYNGYINTTLGINVAEEINKILNRKIEERRKRSNIFWVLPKDKEKVSPPFSKKEEDITVYDELTSTELLYSEKYSCFKPLIKALKEYSIAKTNVGGFHRNDCVLRCKDILENYFKVEIDDPITDIYFYSIYRHYLKECRKKHFKKSFYPPIKR